MQTTTRSQTFGDEYLDWKDWPSQRFGTFDTAQAQYFSAETGIREGYGLTVLEIGYGNGAMLGWLLQTGAQVFGIEANPRLVEEGRRLIGETRAFADMAPIAQRTGTFTHIIAFDVLEHVPQEAIGPLLAQAASLLAAEGRIILRFPNGDSPFGRVYQNGDPTHVTAIGRNKLEYFARRAGLQIEVLRAPALPRHGAGPARALRRLLLSATRQLVERVIALLYFGGTRIPLEPNYVAVLSRRAAAPEA